MSVLGVIGNLPAAAFGLLSPRGHKPLANSAQVSGGTRAQTASSGSSATGSSATNATNIGSTFLNLLVKELQNQDPTAPMDSTAMVGQMISLNQLDQLIAINQAVNPSTASSSGTSGGTTAHAVRGVGANASSTNASSADALAARSAVLAGVSPAANGPSPFSTDATLNAAAASASSAGVLNLNSLNSIFGGK